jgi:hypothetical protein
VTFEHENKKAAEMKIIMTALRFNFVPGSSIDGSFEFDPTETKGFFGFYP